MAHEDFSKQLLKAMATLIISSLIIFTGTQLLNARINTEKIERHAQEIERIRSEKVDKVNFENEIKSIQSEQKASYERMEVMRKEWREDQKDILTKIESLRR